MSTWFVLALAIAVAGALGLQRLDLRVLEEQRALEQARQAQLAATLAASRRLQAQLSAIDVAGLRQTREVLAGRREQAPANPATIAAPRPRSIDSAAGPMRDASSWTNRGYSNPADAVETLLYAAVKNDLTLLAQGLTLEGDARAQAEAIWTALSDATRAQYRSPEQLTALFVARNALDVSAMQILTVSSGGAGKADVLLRLRSDHGDERDNFFRFRSDGHGWQLCVPERVIDRMRAALQAPAAASMARP